MAGRCSPGSSIASRSDSRSARAAPRRPDRPGRPIRPCRALHRLAGVAPAGGEVGEDAPVRRPLHEREADIVARGGVEQNRVQRIDVVPEAVRTAVDDVFAVDERRVDDAGAADEVIEVGDLVVVDEDRALLRLRALGFRPSPQNVQPRRSLVIDLSGSEAEILGRMKQKTRYNVRLGPKKGLSMRIGEESDWPLLYKMYAETSIRDGFVIRDQAYYEHVWRTFAPRSAALIAEFEGQPVAAVYLFHFAGRAYYLYGMSREAQRDKMPNYMLQFEAMRWARQQGCTVYDLWGAPEDFIESDPLWGVFRFKEGLGGQVVRTLGAWDYAPNPLWYAAYTRLMPAVLDVMRSRGRQRTRQGIQA